MARRYAEHTKVPVVRSMETIRKLVEARGASDYAVGRRDGEEFIAFVFANLPVVFKAPPLPAKCKNPDQERRRQWRVLELWVKGQFEAMDAGQLEPVEAFMPYLQLTDGRTAGQAVREEGVRALGSNLALPAPKQETP